MKLLFSFVVISLLLCGCTIDKQDNNAMKNGIEHNTSTVVRSFLNNPSTLEHLSATNEIESFKKEAELLAKLKLPVDTANILEILRKAKKYKHCVLLVENHTIVKLDMDKPCKPSGSWNCCMPYGYGYIKKGKLVRQEAYINNIIGRPDHKKRVAYFFK